MTVHKKRSSGVSELSQAFYQTPCLPFLVLRTTLDSIHGYAAHLHGALSLGLILKGRTLLRCGNSNLEASEGQMVLFAPEEVHSCNPIGGMPRSYHMLYIDPSWAKTILGATSNATLLVANRIVHDKTTFSHLAALANAIRKGIFSDHQEEVKALIGTIRVNCRAVSAPPGLSPVMRRSKMILADAYDEGSPDIACLAKRIGMGRERFIRTFRRAAGITPGGYRQCLRLQRAQELLRRGSGIAAAALACGYADQSHFHRMCVKYLSATPRQLKTRIPPLRKSSPQHK